MLHSCKDFTPNTYSQFTHARYLRVAWRLNSQCHSSSNRRSTTLPVPRKIKSLLLQKDCLNKGRRCSVQYFLCIDRIMWVSSHLIIAIDSPKSGLGTSREVEFLFTHTWCRVTWINVMMSFLILFGTSSGKILNEYKKHLAGWFGSNFLMILFAHVHKV